MNDERTGQLTNGWQIPDYAHKLLWLETESETVPVEGQTGSFALTTPAQRLILRWGGDQGMPLAVLRWQPDNLGWDGTVKIGGYVDALHLTELPNAEITIGVMHTGGQPLRPAAAAYTPAALRQRLPYTAPDYFESVDDSLEEAALMWLIGEESPLYAMAENALLNKLRVWCFGRLAETGSGWDQLFALPLLLEAMTLFAP